MSRSTNNPTIVGVVLIALGVLFLLGQSLNLSGSIWLIGLGALFLVGYFARRSYGLLIPGCILLGLGAGEAIGFSDLGLGLGFIAIFAVDTLVYRTGAAQGGSTSHWWPLIPGVIIAGSAVANSNRALFGSFGQVIHDWWPLLLVGLGVLLLVQQFVRAGRAK